MGGATREFYVHVIREALAILDDTDVSHLVIGGCATRALLGKPLSEAEDLDVLVGEADAEKLLGVFSDAGYSTHVRDERWIYKAARPDVTVDLIFRAGESIPLDEQHLAHATTANLEDIPLPVPATEDLIVMKSRHDAADRQGPWYQSVSLLQRYEIDWDYLAERAAAHAPRRVLALLLYASEDGVAVPDATISRLMSAVT